MLMQALFSRGDTPFVVQMHNFKYTFERNEFGDFVANVLSEEHRTMMEQGGNFKRYTQPEETVSCKEEKETETPKIMREEVKQPDVILRRRGAK